MVISWAILIQSQLTISSETTRRLKAVALACSGAEVALNPAVNPGSPSLSGQLDGGKYEARLMGEGGRLNVNFLLYGDDPRKLEILRRYLENKGIDLNEREAMVDALLDWVSPNVGVHHLNAPPESDDYHPAHAPLTRIDELKKVAGWADFTATPGWDDDFTVNSEGPIDLAWASHDVLLALLGPVTSPDVVDRFLELRRGPDGIDGTADDMRFSVSDALAALGVHQDQVQEISPNVLAQKGQTFRVTSVGTAGNGKRTVQIVFRRVGVTAQVITWNEF
jgi:type II secretory pathway component PulK